MHRHSGEGMSMPYGMGIEETEGYMSNLDFFFGSFYESRCHGIMDI